MFTKCYVTKPSMSQGVCNAKNLAFMKFAQMEPKKRDKRKWAVRFQNF